MFLLNKKLQYKQPSIREKRNGNVLLVWPEIGEWMVVDEEANVLFEQFSGTVTANEIISKNKLENKNEIKKIINELCSKSILFSRESVKPVINNKISIASITFNITNKCNQKCKWCYNTGNINDEIDINILTRAIDFNSEIFEKNISFIVLGGEPFLHFERLEKLLNFVNSKLKTPVLVSTNGMLINSQIIKKIKNKKIEVQVSLDSPNKEHNDNIRGRGTYKKILENVKLLTDAKIYTILSMVYTKNSIEEFEEYLKLSEKLNVQEARFIPLKCLGGGVSFYDLLPNQFEAFQNLIGIVKNKPKYKKLLGRDFFSISESICKHSSLKNNCGLGERVIFINADGKVYPCPNFINDDYLCGDLKDKKLSDIIKNSNTLDQVREKYQIQNFYDCRECDFRHWCAGDCRAEARAVSKTDLGRSPHCEELKKMYIEFFWLLSENFSFSENFK